MHTVTLALLAALPWDLVGPVLQGTPNQGQGGLWGGLPSLNNLLQPLLTWATSGIATVAAIILVWGIYEQWTQNPERFSWFNAAFRALGVGLVATVAFNASRIINFFLNPGGTP